MSTTNTPPTDDNQAIPDTKVANLGRRDWLKSAMAAGAAVASAVAVVRAEAQEAPTKTADAGDAGSAAKGGESAPAPPELAAAAEYGIVLHNSKIKGNVTLTEFKGSIPATHCGFSSSAQRGSKSGTGKLSVEQSPVSVDIRAGRWVAELQQACFDGLAVGDVAIAMLAGSLDGSTPAEPKVVQKITLTNAVVTQVEQSWDAGDGNRGATVSFSFDKILFEIGTKPADFTMHHFVHHAV